MIFPTLWPAWLTGFALAFARALGEFGSVVGKPNWPEYQRRVLDESLRLIEPIDQPSVRNLVVAAATEVEMERGER